MIRITLPIPYPRPWAKKIEIMRAPLITIPLLLTLLISCDHSKKIIEHEWRVYAAVMEHDDMVSAMVSLNRILAVEKYNQAALDTLARLYLNTGANSAAAKVAFRALNVKQTDATTAIAAKANKNLGNFELALEHFNKLLLKDPGKLEWLYEVAYANINLGKLNDALPYIEKLINHPGSEKAVMQEFINEGSQLLPYRAVAYNMLGYIQTRAGQDQAAIKSYEAAIRLFPEYYLAGNNLKVLREKSGQ